MRDLRASQAVPGDLPEVFARIAHDLSFDHAVQFAIVTRGAERELACTAREEIYGVASAERRC